METKILGVFFNAALFRAELGVHKDKAVIWVKFPKDFELIAHLKKFTKPRWSSSQKCWYLSDHNSNRILFGLEEKFIGKDFLLKLGDVNRPAIFELINCLTLKGYSPNTIKTYCTEFAHLLFLLKDFPVQNLSPEKLKSYILYCINELHVSENHLHSKINAIKFYFEKVLKREKMFFDIPRPKKPLLLPKALNAKEISSIIEVTENPKHKLIIKFCYGMGLRVSEISNIKVEHIDSQNMRVLISQSKGKKDRYVNLPDSVLADLRSYYKIFKPKEYLFEGQSGGQYSIRSVQNVFKTAMRKAKVYKNVGVHTLRHSYATHLLEAGTDISLIQKLLGHNDIKTTLLYTQVVDRTLQNVKSPLGRI